MSVFYSSSDLFARDMTVLAISALIALALGTLALRRRITTA